MYAAWILNKSRLIFLEQIIGNDYMQWNKKTIGPGGIQTSDPGFYVIGSLIV